MREKEQSVLIYIHHIATFLGFFAAVFQLRERKKSSFKKAGLFFFVLGQGFAVVKIICDWWEGKSRLWKSIEKIQTYSKNEYEERGILWSLILLSAIWKIGVPKFLSEK